MNWRILALLLPLLLAGCAEENATQITAIELHDAKNKTGKPKTVFVTISHDPPFVSIETEPDQPQPIPRDFPLPLYPGAKPLDVTEHPDMGNIQVMAEIEPIKDSPKLIGDFYRKKLQAMGWTIEPPDKTLNSADQVEISALKRNQSLAVTVWNHEHDHDQDFTGPALVKHLHSKATTVWLNWYTYDHDVEKASH